MDSRPGEACQRPLGIRRAVDEEFARPGGVGDDDERHAVGQEESSIPRRPPGASPSRQRAQSTHGSARLTMDVDVVYSRRRANVERGLNFTLTTDLGPLDLLGEIPGGGTFEELRPEAVTLRVFGVDCLCLSLLQLIRAKRAAGRPKDLEAIAELEALLEE